MLAYLLPTGQENHPGQHYKAIVTVEESE